MKGKFYNHTISIANSNLNLGETDRKRVLCIPIETEPLPPKSKLSFRNKSETKLYLWKSSIPPKWFQIRGKSSFKKFKREEDSKRGTLDYLRETYRYITKITQPIPTTLINSYRSFSTQKVKPMQTVPTLELDKQNIGHNRVKSMPVFTNKKNFYPRPCINSRFTALPNTRKKLYERKRPETAGAYRLMSLKKENSARRVIFSRDEERSKRSYNSPDSAKYENGHSRAELMNYFNMRYT